MPLVVPPPPAEHRAPGFPWLGALAPVLAAAILFAVTRSPLALAFAALGPVTAVASMIDGARQARGARRRDRNRREEALVTLAREVDAEHDRRRRAADADLPDGRTLVDLPRPSAPLDTGTPRPVRVGLADIDSGIHLETQDPTDADLVAEAALLRDAPFVLDAAGGIGVVGSPALRAALADTLRAQLTWRAGPSGRIPSVAHASHPEELPEHCRVLLEIDGPRTARVVRAPKLDDLRAFRPELLGGREREALVGRAASAGVLPAAVELPDLPIADSGRLSAVFAVGEAGPVEIDLVRDGPHALVGGTTGSGKSELLVSWLLALTTTRTPSEVGLMLFDFKGGAAFDPLAELPHVRGLVTDLDGTAIERATASLGAELRSREERLRAAGARSADEMPELGRLVIVVDEFAAMLAERRELHDVFVDVAARGRSLGVHLVLCTQRPAGVVRDSLAANCALRISLRVVDRGDSTAVVGDDSAARIPRTLPGRAVVAMHGEPPFPVQVASVARERLSVEVGRRSGHSAPADSGWLPPLPRHLPVASLPARSSDGAVRLGLLDVPEQQAQPLAEWIPSLDGALLVAGAPGAGRSTALRTIAEELGAAVIGGAQESGQETAAELLADEILEGGAGSLVVDDLDALLDRLEQDHRIALLEHLPAAIRARGRRVAFSIASPATPTGRSLSAVAATRLALRLASADEHRAAVGSTIAHDARLRPGGGVWAGARVQVALPAVAPESLDRAAPPRSGLGVPTLPARLAPGTLLVTSTPDSRIASLTAHGAVVLDGRDPATHLAEDPAAVTVVDPLGWQSALPLWSRIGRTTVVYDRCRLADYRTVARDRSLPPVLDGADRVWLAQPGRPSVRAIWVP